MCNTLTVENHTSVEAMMNLIGNEDFSTPKDRRVSKFLKPHDTRFSYASISPDVPLEQANCPISYFGIGGKAFVISFEEIRLLFPVYRIQCNTYDGGSQIFFYPVSKKYSFKALSFQKEEEPEDLPPENELFANNLQFQFGSHLTLGRDGWFMKT